MFSKKITAAAIAAISMAAGGAAFAADAGTSSTLTVSANLTSACSVTDTSSIAFGDVAALLSTGDKEADSVDSFKVACSLSVAQPAIYVTGTRSLVKSDDNTKTIPFKLTLTSGAATEIGADLANKTDISLSAQDGTAKPVKLYAKILANDFKGLPSGNYGATMYVNVAY